MQGRTGPARPSPFLGEHGSRRILHDRWVGQGGWTLAVRTRGTVHFPGDADAPLPVAVVADEGRLALTAGSHLIGDWEPGTYGFKSVADGFLIWAEGEELFLETEDDVGLAVEMGLGTATLRLARKTAASQRRADPPWPDPEPEEDRFQVAAIAFALAGVMVLAGGVFLRDDPTLSSAQRAVRDGLGPGGGFWLAFILAGAVIVLAAIALGTRRRWARSVAVVSVAGPVVVFGLAAQEATPEADHLLAYGFIAGGIVIGVAVLFGGLLGERD